jgi:hypothetical protein
MSQVQLGGWRTTMRRCVSKPFGAAAARPASAAWYSSRRAWDAVLALSASMADYARAVGHVCSQARSKMGLPHSASSWGEIRLISPTFVLR